MTEIKEIIIYYYDTNIIREKKYVNNMNQLHNEDGPAWINYSGDGKRIIGTQYYLNNKKIIKELFIVNKLNKLLYPQSLKVNYNKKHIKPFTIRTISSGTVLVNTTYDKLESFIAELLR